MLSFDFGEAAARPRAGAVVPRIQLHDPAGLRLRRARTSATAASCRWAARTSGATSSTASTSAAGWATPQLYALTCAAAHHGLGRQDGQDRGRRGLAQRRPAEPLRLLAVLAQHRGRRCRALPEAVHDAAAGRDRAARSARRAPRSTRRRRCWRPRRPRSCTAARPPSAAAETARKTFEEGALAESLPTVEVPRAVLEAGLGVLTAFGPDYAKLVPSTSEARRQVKGGGLRVNDQAGDGRARRCWRRATSPPKA